MLRLFCDYITSVHHALPAEYEARFGTHPVHVYHEWNTAVHVDDGEGHLSRRLMTRTEIQLLLDHADERIERADRLSRKGALAAYRDATVFIATPIVGRLACRVSERPDASCVAGVSGCRWRGIRR